MNTYPIYIPSHNRSTHCKSAEACLACGLDFTIVVEPSQYDSYAQYFPEANIHKLKYNGKGIAYKRNAIIQLAKKGGHAAHWQIDDKVGKFFRRDSENNIVPITIKQMIRAIEREFDLYADLVAHGPGVTAFARKFNNGLTHSTFPYSCWLQRTDSMPKFRPETLDDVDYAMQLVTSGHCIMRSNIYLRNTCTSGSVKGGNSVVSKSSRDALNTKVAQVVEYFKDYLEIDEHKRKDGVWDVRPKKRLSLLFPQRPTLASKGKRNGK